MSIVHHPSEMLLSMHAAGELDEGQSLAIATHLESCRLCRDTVLALESIGGAALETVAPVGMSAGTLERTRARLERLPSAGAARPKPIGAEAPLPKCIQRYGVAHWKWVAPGVSMRPILLPRSSQTRAFLLKSSRGTSMLQHSHSGIEMTCVLAGSFSHEGGRFSVGDFDFGDAAIDHQPVVGSEEECICLVAMAGELRFHGVFGRVIQPFIRL